MSLWSEAAAATADALAEFDPPHAETYRANAGDVSARGWPSCTNMPRTNWRPCPPERRVLVTAHDAFRYFGRAYGVEVRGIQGISTDSEAGVRQVKELVDFLVERKIKAVFVETSVSDQNIRSLLEGCQVRGHDVVDRRHALLRRHGRGRHARRNVRGNGQAQRRYDRQALQCSECNAPLLDIHDVTVAYHRRPVLWDVDLTIDEPQLAAVVGPNGAGKSTLIKAVLGLVPMASGRVQVFGQPVAQGPPADRLCAAARKRRLGFSGQRARRGADGHLWPARLDSPPRQGRAPVGPPVPGKGRPGQLRAAADRPAFRRPAAAGVSGPALAQKADIYFMDEPMAGVDAATERMIFQVLRELRDEGKTIIAVHHDLRTVPQYFDYVVLLNVRLVAAGPDRDRLHVRETCARPTAAGWPCSMPPAKPSKPRAGRCDRLAPAIRPRELQHAGRAGRRELARRQQRHHRGVRRASQAGPDRRRLSHAALPGLCLAFLILRERQSHGHAGRGAGQRRDRHRDHLRPRPLDARQGRRRDRHRADRLLRPRHRAAEDHPEHGGIGSKAGLNSYILGKTAGMTRGDVYVILAASLRLPGLIVLLYKEFQLVSFDSDFARSLGWPVFAHRSAAHVAGRGCGRDRPAEGRRGPHFGPAHHARRGGPVLDRPTEHAA